MHEVLLGLGPVILAIIAIATSKLARTTNKTDPLLWALAAIGVRDRVRQDPSRHSSPPRPPSAASPYVEEQPPHMSSRQEEKERRRQERIAREEADRRAASRRRRLQLAGGGAALVAVGATMVVIAATGRGHSTSSSAAPAGSGLLASTDREASGSAVDGIQCQTMEQAIFHIHAHLAIYVGGHQRLVPEGIGIPAPRNVQQTSQGPFVASGSCFYWLHSHTRDGIIHIESPVQRVFTLGNYFDLWKQPLGARRVGPATGPVTAYFNGRRFAGDPRSIPLKAHALIQLDIGTPVVQPVPFIFQQGL